MALPPSGTTDQAFLREVDEEYRRERMTQIFQRYGKWIIAGVVLFLLALAGFLYWQHHSQQRAGVQGEQFDAAMRTAVEQPDKAGPALAKVAAESSEGYAAIAKIAEANLLLGKNDVKGAAAKFAEVANNAAYEQPLRDLALVRQTAVEFDTLQPQVVIDRLKGLANPNSPWLGTAGEMVGAAYLKMGNRAEAGRMFGQIAQAGEKVPESIRQRVVQLAGVLGVDAIDQSKETKTQ